MLEWFGLLWQHPWYALTALAVIIPIIIHLLNRSRGKLVTFAHVALLRSTKPQPTSELRLTQRILLLLRLLLLLTAAALLTSPFWPQSSSDKELIMLSQDWLNNSSQAEKQQLATRLASQQAILLNSPAKSDLSQSLSSEDILHWQNQSSASSLNLWSKIQSHSVGLNTTTPLVVYATNRASQFVGDKIAIANPVEWKLKDLTNDNTKAPQPLSILLIYQEDRQADVSYINAALSALQKQSAISIQLRSLSDNEFAQQSSKHNLPTAQLILWLSSAPLTPELFDNSKQPITILLDAPQLNSKLTSKQKWQLASPTTLLAGLSGNLLTSDANSAFDAELSQVLWQTQQGLPLLSEVKTEHSKLLQFYSRFNPQWSDLPELPAFPLILAEIIDKASPTQSAQQFINEAQITQKSTDNSSSQADLANPNNANNANKTQNSQLTSLLAILLLVLFCLERLYSEKALWRSETVIGGEI